MSLKIRSFFAIALSLAISFPATAQDEKLELLLNRSPSPPNAMGYVNIGSLNQLMDDAGMSPSVSENVDDFWFISDLDISKLQPKWEAGYATVKQPVEASKLAKRLGGYVDEIANQKVVWSPDQTYFVPGKENRLGMLRPADRSLLTQWINDDRGYNFSSYLQSQSKPPEDYLSLMLAIDLHGAFSPVPMTKKLEGLTSLKSKRPEAVASILASIDGVSVLIGRRGLNECIVRASFSKAPASLEPIAAELLAELMERGGSAAPEVATWKVSTKENVLSLQGPITESTLSGLMGIFSLQDRAQQANNLGTGGSANPSKSEQAAYRSKKYFDDVNKIVEQTRKHSSQTTGALAKWNDARARKIDELGTLGVDDAMIQFGTNVGELLRGNALTVRQGNIDAGKIKANQGLYNGGYYNNSDGYGYDFNSTADYNRVTAAKTRGNAYADYKDALYQIDQLTAATRRTMTEKFQIQF